VEGSPIRHTLLLGRALLLVLILCSTRKMEACDRLPSGQTLWIRLSAPISTYTAKPGDPVHAVLTRDLVCGDDVLLPAGSPVEGIVHSRRKVGLGIRHETAALELVFNRAISASGVAIPLSARVEEVENARESVRNGVIQGIRSSNTFQGSISSTLIHLPTWNLYSDPVLIAFKAAFPIFPEPEIHYPAGTDLRIRTTSAFTPPSGTISHDLVPQDSTSDAQLDRLVDRLPTRVVTKNNVDADVINLVFIGSEQMIRSAFHNAGWENSDPVSHRAIMKNLYALLNNSGYRQEPMTTFYLDGVPEDMNWQKSLNSYDRRDHLRIWQWKSKGSAEPIWISSSTHDTGAVLAIKHKGFMHHIAPNIDEERSAVVRDLSFAGCVQSVHYVSRSSSPVSLMNATGDIMHTDNAVAVIELKECRPDFPQPAAEPSSRAYKSGNHLFRFARRQILTFRNDIFRANIVYGSYRGTRMALAAMRHPQPISQSASSAEPPYTPAREAFTSVYSDQAGIKSPRRPYQLRTVH
jgi:hypothetical protein